MLRPSHLLVVAVLASAATVAAPAFADPPAEQARWVRLGSRTVDGKADRDVLRVGRDAGSFKEIRLEVEGSALALHEVKIHFGNGDVFEPKTRLVFEKGSMSRVIDLPGERRHIDRIELRYGNLPGGGRARLEVFAR